MVWCIPAAVAEVVPVGSETSWAPLVARVARVATVARSRAGVASEPTASQPDGRRENQ